MNKTLSYIMMLAWMPISIACADYSADQLHSNATILNEMIQMSPLATDLGYYASRFVEETEYFAHCLESGSYECSTQFIQEAWDPLDLYLKSYAEHGTQIFEQYLQTQDSYFLVVQHPSVNQPETLSVKGRINFQDFFFSGSSRLAISQSCLDFARSAGITFVKRLIINNESIHLNSKRIEQVCETISQYATLGQ